MWSSHTPGHGAERTRDPREGSGRVRVAERSATLGGFVGAVLGARGGPVGAGVGGLVGGSTGYAVGYGVGALAEATDAHRPARRDKESVDPDADPVRIHVTDEEEYGPLDERPSEDEADGTN